jgi:hypothetical protein
MLVKSCIVDTDASYVGVFLWDNDWVRYPTRCFDFLDEAGIFPDDEVRLLLLCILVHQIIEEAALLVVL